MTKRCSFPVFAGAASRATFLFLCCISVLLASCAGKDGASPSGSPRSGASVSPTEKRLAYGIVVDVPTSYNVARMLTPDEASKASLESLKAGERVLLFEAAGPPSPRGIEPMVAVLAMNQQGSFVEYDLARQIKPEEFAAFSKEVLASEKAEAKKNKKQPWMLDVQINRETINGNMAIVHRILVPGPDGKPARVTNWDIYLPNGSGIAVKSVYDQEYPEAESEIFNIVRSARVQ